MQVKVNGKGIALIKQDVLHMNLPKSYSWFKYEKIAHHDFHVLYHTDSNVYNNNQQPNKLHW